MSLWLGIDPGGKYTGLCVRKGRDVISRAVLTRDLDPIDGVPYCWAVTAYASALAASRPGIRVAVEGVRAPNPHLGMTNVSALLDTAIVLGAVLQRFPDAVIVPPGRHGKMVLGMYPDELVTDGERRAKGWRARVGESTDMRHARSAYDVAGAAPAHDRIADAARRAAP